MFFRKEVFIHTLYFYFPVHPYAYTKLYHEFCQALTIDQNDALLKAFGIVYCLFAEARRCNEYALVRAEADQAADEALNIRSADA